MVKTGTDLYITGVFTTVSNAPRLFMAKVPATGGGTVDGSFIPNPNGNVIDMVVAGGALFVGGRFSTTSGAASAGFAKLDLTTGSAQAGFSGSVTTEGNVYCMQLLPDGKMMVGGAFDTVNGSSRIGLARINKSGTLDSGFQLDLYGHNPVVNDFKVDGSNIYIAGEFLKAGGNPVTNVARFNWSTGALDTGWAPHPFTPLNCVETDANYVYIGSGGLLDVDTTQVGNLARVGKSNPAVVDGNWTPYVTYGGNPSTASVLDMVFDGNDLIIGGLFTHIVDINNVGSPYQRICAAELHTSGPNSGLPPTAGWAAQFTDQFSNPARVEHLLLYNGSLYVSGDFAFVNATEQECIAKLSLVDGAYDSNFFPSPIDSGDTFFADNVRSIAGFGSQIYIGGNYQFISNGSVYVSHPYLSRVDQNTGALDPSWDPATDDSVDVLSFNGPDLWIWGLYQEVVGQPYTDIVILRPFTSSYQTWLNTFFSPSQRTDSNFNAVSADLDLDGLTNFVEFAFNMNPFSGNVSPMTAGTGTSGLPLLRSEMISSQRYLTCEYVRWKAAVGPGVDYAVEFADAITGPWSARGVTLSVTSINANFERVKVRDSVANPAKVFGRVSLTPTTP
jgi:hypothetical protein